MNNPLTFTAEESNSTINLAANGSPVINGLYYRLNENDDWISYKIETKIKLKNVGDYIQFRNINNELSTSYFNFVQFKITGKIAASGNIQSMLNYSDSCQPYCFYDIFRDCTSLTKAPELPATNLAESCYAGMFIHCTSLVEAPELPASNLVDGGYSSMFWGCTSLVKAPKLPATTLAEGCYFSMFRNCTNLTKAPEFPATTLAKYCYCNIFENCKSLIEAPELLATTLAEGCYENMFKDCSKLKNKPKINSLIEKVVYIH